MIAAVDIRKQDGIQHMHGYKICRAESSVCVESTSAVLKHEYEVVNRLTIIYFTVCSS